MNHPDYSGIIEQFRRVDGCRAQVPDNDAGGLVGEGGGIDQRFACCQRGGQDGHDRIAGPTIE